MWHCGRVEILRIDLGVVVVLLQSLVIPRPVAAPVVPPLPLVEPPELIQSRLSLNIVIMHELRVVKGNVGEHFKQFLRYVDLVHVLGRYLIPDALVTDDPSAGQGVDTHLLGDLGEHVAAYFHHKHLFAPYFFLLLGLSFSVLVFVLFRSVLVFLLLIFRSLFLFFLDYGGPWAIVSQHVIVIVVR